MSWSVHTRSVITASAALNTLVADSAVDGDVVVRESDGLVIERATAHDGAVRIKAGGDVDVRELPSVGL